MPQKSKLTMGIETFIKRFEQEFEDLAPGTLRAETNFRELDEWSSMQALIVIAMIDVDFGVTITAEELKKAVTIADIYYVVLKKAA